MLEESWHIHNWRERRNRSLHYNIQLLFVLCCVNYILYEVSRNKNKSKMEFTRSL